MRTKITILQDGTIAGILDEKFDTSGIGKRDVKRLSQVAWFTYDQSWHVYDETADRWIGKSFKTREKAIAYERWYMDRKFKKVLKFAGVK